MAPVIKGGFYCRRPAASAISVIKAVKRKDKPNDNEDDGFALLAAVRAKESTHKLPALTSSRKVHIGKFFVPLCGNSPANPMCPWNKASVDVATLVLTTIHGKKQFRMSGMCKSCVRKYMH